MSGERVLVVTRNSDALRHLKDIVLAPAGYQVQAVGDGMSAVTIAGETRPDLVVADAKLPGLSGIDLARRVHHDNPELPVILLADEGTQAEVLEALRAGATDYVLKPYEAEHLLAAVGRALDERRRWEDLMKSRIEAGGDAASLQRRLTELETLAGVGRTVTALLDLDEVLTSVVDAAVRLTGAEEGSLLLQDEEFGAVVHASLEEF